MSYIDYNNAFLYIPIAALVIFVIFYLVRPKPLEKTMPSLMFILKRKDKNKMNALFRKLVRDPLFLIQLLAIMILGFAILEPAYLYDKDVSMENTILVLDASASMKAGERWENARSIAIDKSYGSVSLVLVQDTPNVIFTDKGERDARNMIRDLRPWESSSAIVDSIRKADEILGNRTGRIVVISDFVETEKEQDELLNYKSFLEGKGRIIDYEVMAPVKSNIGFVDYHIDKNMLTLMIRNFNDAKEEAVLEMGDKEKTIELLPQSTEEVRLEVFGGRTTIGLKNKDDFALDNKFYINVPHDRKIKVLLITNNQKTFLSYLLEEAPNVELSIVSPPSLPNIEHDLVIVNSVKESVFITPIVDRIEKYVASGGTCIVTYQEDLDDLGLEKILPIEPSGNKIAKAEVSVKVEQELTKDLTFPEAVGFAASSAKDGSVVILESIDESKSPIFSYSRSGQGWVMYYGYPEKDNDFKLSAAYPIFWNRLLTFRFNKFEDLNVKTVDVAADSGFEGDRAINLLNEQESSVTSTSVEGFLSELSAEKKDGISEQREELSYWLIIALTLVLLGEIIFIKYRGDL